MRNKDITQEKLKQHLHYDAETGVFTRKTKTANMVKIGEVAGSIHPNGRIYIRVLSTPILAHRLAWLYVYGEMPYMIDHINGNPADNRISNLRVCDRNMNLQNQRKAQKHNKLGLLGVSQKGNRYVAQISINNKIRYLGLFKTPEEAHEAYVSHKRVLHAGCTI